MRSPQKDDGYTPIAHELLEAIVAHPFGKRHYKVVLHVARKTYGYNKKTDAMSYGQIAENTGLRRQHAIATVQELVAMNVLNCTKSGVEIRGGELNEIGINKDYSAWLTSPKTVTSEHETTSTQNGTSPKTGLVPKQESTSPKTGCGLVPKQGPTKDNQQKKTQKKGTHADETPEGVPEDAWADFVQHRKEIGHPLKPQGAKRAASKLRDLSAKGHDPRKVIDLAIENGWRGLFENEKTKSSQSNEEDLWRDAI